MEHGAEYNGDYIFNVDYNHIYNYGGDILSDFGGVYITSNFNCDGASEDELDKHCYTHARVFNNWLENSEAFANGAGYLYSDVSASGTRFEKNIQYPISNIQGLRRPSCEGRGRRPSITTVGSTTSP